MNIHTLSDGSIQNRRPIAQIMIQCMAAMVIGVFSLSVAAAADLIGKVQKENGEPVADATVKLVPGNQTVADQEKSTTTDRAGRFAISGVVPGRYSLICKKGDQESQVPVKIDFAINRYDCTL